MLKLIIKHADGSPYWTEHFNSLSDCDKWLNTEKTRPYWKQDFVVEKIDMTPPPKSAAEIAAEEAKKAAVESARLAIKDFKKSDMKTVDDLALLLEKFAIMLGVK